MKQQFRQNCYLRLIINWWIWVAIDIICYTLSVEKEICTQKKIPDRQRQNFINTTYTDIPHQYLTKTIKNFDFFADGLLTVHIPEISRLAEVSHEEAKWVDGKTSAGFWRISYHACAGVSLQPLTFYSLETQPTEPVCGRNFSWNAGVSLTIKVGSFHQSINVAFQLFNLLTFAAFLIQSCWATS